MEAFRKILEEILAREGAALLPVHPDARAGPAPRPPSGSTRRPRGCAAAASEVLVTEGSQQGLDLVARVLIDPGDVVLVERPSYIGATSAFRAAQARMVGVRLGPEGLDLDHLRAQLPRGDGGRPPREVPVRDPQLPEPVGHQPFRSPRAARCSRSRASWTSSSSRTIPTATSTSRRSRCRRCARWRARPRSCTSRRSPRSSPPGCAPRS